MGFPTLVSPKLATHPTANQCTRLMVDQPDVTKDDRKEDKLCRLGAPLSRSRKTGASPHSRGNPFKAIHIYTQCSDRRIQHGSRAVRNIGVSTLRDRGKANGPTPMRVRVGLQGGNPVVISQHTWGISVTLDWVPTQEAKIYTTILRGVGQRVDRWSTGRMNKTGVLWQKAEQVYLIKIGGERHKTPWALGSHLIKHQTRSSSEGSIPGNQINPWTGLQIQEEVAIRSGTV